jgi:protein TonB
MGEWSVYENNKLVNKEIFEKGQFVNGIAYTDNGEFPYTALEMQVEFNGGLPALGKFISQVMRYPADARKKRLEGQVFISFVVEKDGSLSEIKVVKGIAHTLDIEALRVVNASDKKWSPGRQRGHPIRSRFVLPLRFKLENF